MQLRPLHREFGVEVLDLDILNQPTHDDISELKRALDYHQLLLFRNPRPISPERHLEIGSWFGEPCDDGAGKLVMVLHNENAAGSIRLPFHSDYSYTDFPLQVISLHALELPGRGTTTSFVSSAAAWANLNSDAKARLAPLTVRHRHLSTVNKDWPDFEADHSMCMTHPRSGRPILYITEHHAERIRELSADESDRILQELFAQMYAPEHVYVHQWSNNDLIVWDNVAVQHARREESAIADGARAMQRVTMGERGFGALLEQARQRQTAVG